MASSCKKDSSKPCANFTPYSFNVSSNFTPEKATYQIGDTIFLTSSFPFILLNAVTNKELNYSNSLGIGGTVTFSRLDTTLMLVKDAYDKFIVFPLEGNVVPINNTPNKGVFGYYFQNTDYQFKIGIVVNQKGIYSLGFNDLSSQGLRGKDCTNAKFNMTVTNPNKHLDLFLYAIGYASDAYLAQHIYCFRVN